MSEVEKIADLRTRLAEQVRWGMLGVSDPVTFSDCADALADQAAEIEWLREHIAEQADHAETRIKDGDELGERVWRIALEDIVRESRAALQPKDPAR